jgi:hypothetical protein
MSQVFVPVISNSGKQLMPTSNRKADKLIARGRAVRRFDRADGYIQPIAVGIDPGSKKEAFTAKSASHTYLNVQADAVNWVKDAEAVSTTMRRSRRYRKTPYRAMRTNRRQGQFKLPPSTRARWDWKLRICTWLARYLPISSFMVEDVKATTRQGKRHWNQAFSPLEVGKQWFYQQLSLLAPVQTQLGYDTKVERDRLGLRKSGQKTSDKFTAHCIDSWVMANKVVGGHLSPENTAMLYLVPLRFHRRQLHRLEPAKGGIRLPYGGSMSLGFKRGSWVKHPKHGLCYIGGSTKGRISLHSLQTGARLCQNAKPTDLTFLCTASWRLRKEQRASSTH